MTSVPGAPLGLKCHESLLYVAAGSSVVAIDLRTMQKVTTAAVCQPKVCSFEIMPSKYLICTGGFGKAMLWDIRKSQAILNPEPVAELDGNTGPLTQLHMDSYKIVAGAPEDQCVNVWETDSGQLINSLCCFPGASARFSAMAVDKCRIVTAGCDTDRGLICFRDFNDASLPVAAHEDDHKDGPISKFWETQLDGEVE